VTSDGSSQLCVNGRVKTGGAVLPSATKDKDGKSSKADPQQINPVRMGERSQEYREKKARKIEI